LLGLERASTVNFDLSSKHPHRIQSTPTAASAPGSAAPQTATIHAVLDAA
jgi:hypothetical protein